MQREILGSPTLRWIDVVDPSNEELQELARVHQLHPLFVQDCLDPEHLPKFEHLEDSLFIIIRVYDVHAPKDAANVEELTRKIAIFVRENTLLTIHRAPLPFIDSMIQEYQREKAKNLSLTTFLISLCKNAVLEFNRPLEDAEREIDRLEHQVYSRKSKPTTLLQLHLNRRKLATLKRLFWHTLTVVQRMPRSKKEHEVLYHDLRETVDSLMFFSDELLEDATSLMNLDLSIASQKTNEVIRVLTLFSVFFMPLTFIVGIYGMNFTYMPELHWKWGYPAVWTLMIGITLSIALWFRKRGWL